MANRYRYTLTAADSDTQRVYMKSTIYPKIKATDNDIYAITDAGDRFDLLAKKYYGDEAYWWIIATANNMNDGNFFIKEGIQIRIPSNINAILNDLERINK